MNGIIDRAVLLILGFLCGTAYLDNRIIYLILVGIAAMGLLYFFEDRRLHTVVLAAVCIAMTVSEIFLSLIFLVIYDAVYKIMTGNKTELYIVGSAITICAITFIAGDKACVVNGFAYNYFADIVAAIGIVLAIYLAYLSYYHRFNKAEILRMRDDNEEFRQQMVHKSILMKEKQDSELLVATLNERTRIARDIHDNVGHLLTRSIVQMGALQTIYKEEPLASGLKQVSATLNESMNNIRESVHNLHNESLDLNKSIRELCEKHKNFEYEIEYDANQNMRLDVKYCFIAILQEALGNAEKHSDATTISITVREHPVFYQMIIQDNGHPKRISETGIGLHNMESRVKELNGQISFSTENGFRIFLTVPKTKE